MSATSHVLVGFIIARLIFSCQLFALAIWTGENAITESQHTLWSTLNVESQSTVRMRLLVDAHMPFCFGIERQLENLGIFIGKAIKVVELTSGVAYEAGFRSIAQHLSILDGNVGPIEFGTRTEGRDVQNINNT